jgi:hypothetical protein
MPQMHQGTKRVRTPDLVAPIARAAEPSGRLQLLLVKTKLPVLARQEVQRGGAAASAVGLSRSICLCRRMIHCGFV